MDYSKSRYYGEERGQVTHRRTGRLKCILISSSIFAVAAFVGLVLFLAITKGNLSLFSACRKNGGCSEESNDFNIAPEAQEGCKSVCTNPECMEAASQLVSYMDLTVDPCDDFYTFSCGNRAENIFQLNNGHNIISLSMMSDHLTSKIMQTINAVNEENHQSSSFKRKQLYDSCQKFSRSVDTGVEDIAQWFDRIGLTNWPHLDDHGSISDEDFKRIMGAFLSIDQNEFMVIEVVASGTPEIFREAMEKMGREFSPKTPDGTVMIEIRMSSSCNLNHFEKYENFTASFLPQFGVTADEANRVFADALEVHNLVYAKKQALLKMRSEEEELDCSSPDIALSNRWCSLLLQHVETFSASIDFSNSETILLNGEWFDYLDNFFNEFDRKKIIHYLCLSFILEIMDSLRNFKKFDPPLQLLPKPWTWGCFEFQPLLYGSKHPCMAWLSDNLPDILAKDYIAQHDIVSRAQKVKGLYDSIEDIFKSMVQNSTLIEEEMRIQLMQTVQQTLVEINVFVDYYANEFNEEITFRQLQISPKFISNIISVKKFRAAETIKNPMSYSEASLRIGNKFNVFADAGQVINVGLGFLQLPAIGLTRPSYLDFAQIGSILAHEFSHVLFPLIFQGIGVEGLRCIIEQYSSYQIPVVNVQSNGTITLAENFADNLGFLAAYKAYKNYQEEYEEELSLPGVSYSNEQLFFIYLSQAFCEYGDEKGYTTYIYDSHSPSQQRIHGSLKNIKEFSEVFNCPVGSPMNPENKCEIKF